MKLKSVIATPILLIVVFGLISAGRLIPAARIAADSNPYLSIIVIELIVFALPSVFYSTLRGPEFRRGMRIRFFPLSSIIMILSASVLIIAGSALLGTALSAAAPEAFSSSSTFTVSIGSDTGVFDGLYVVIAFALVPAITEEILFRGIVLSEYTRQGVFCAVFISSVTFAMSHFSFIRFPIYLFSGMVLALVTFATRSLVASIVVHLFNNVFVIFFEDYVIYMARRQNISSVLLIFILACAAFVAAIVTVFEASSFYRSYGKGNADSSYLPEKSKSRSGVRAFSEAVFSPTFLILTVIFVVVTYLI